MKDLFSNHAEEYAQYRPTYPVALFDWLVSQLAATDTAWDCGTGNGQVAAVLSHYFKQVAATDISGQQLQQAPLLPNITYWVVAAEDSHLPDATIDLIVVAQAVHWFQFEAFYAEAKRVLKPNGRIALIGYGLMQVDVETNRIIHQLYSQQLAGYWDTERRYIDEAYQTLPFPFVEILAPAFAMTAKWTLTQLLGYLRTWSAVKHYEKRTGTDPVQAVEQQLLPLWETQAKTITFPLLLRVGK